MTMAKQLLHFVHSGSVNFFLVTMYFDGYIHQGASAPNCKMCSNSQKNGKSLINVQVPCCQGHLVKAMRSVSIYKSLKC